MTDSTNSRRAAVIGGVRIPFARSHGAYARQSNLDMMTAVLQGLVGKYQLDGKQLGEVALGAVIKHSKDWNMAREAVLSSGLAYETPAYDLQRACGTSLSACVQIANQIQAGQIDSGIGAGTDTVSDAPIVYPDEYRDILLASFRARSLGQRLKQFLRIRPRHFKPQFPGVEEPRTKLSMGQSTEITAKEWSISREAQDELALRSHQRAAAAYEAGFFDDLVIPFQGLERDNNLRADSSIEKLAKLKPVFDRGPGGTMTAGNSTPLTDGAAAVLLGTEAWADSNGLKPQAYITHAKSAAVNFIGEEGLLMAPAYAVSAMLQDAGLGLQDFDFYEIHEAFAAQTLATLAAWESEAFCREKLGRDQALGKIDTDKLNVNGSSLAVGHPFAATGARIVATLAKLLAEKGHGRGLISVCTAGGMGVTAILEAAS